MERQSPAEPTRLGKYITAQRGRLGISTYVLAKRTQITNSTIRRLENGERGVTKVSPDLLRKLAVGLEVPASELFAAAGYSQPSDLPEFLPYLRTKYGRKLPASEMNQLAAEFNEIAKRHGLDSPKP